ncbi:hypothetical protein [Rothia nasimurium]|uniref:hypothetical protein n=1 Tax=Rothia nasimurium TaxID=85336 RepID=UPI001F359F4B|nr:hypothetical protein [Rothia nasimurium]
MTSPQTSRRTLATAGLWAAPIVAASTAVPAYSASSSALSPTLTVRWGLFSQVAIEDASAGYTTNVGVASTFGGTSNTSGDVQFDDSTGLIADGATGLVANGEGTFTPGGSLGGFNSGTYGGTGLWFSSPEDTTGAPVAGTAVLASGASFRLNYVVTFPEGWDPFHIDSVRDGETRHLIKQSAGSAVTATGVNSAEMTATYGAQTTNGQQQTVSVTYTTNETITLTSDGSSISTLAQLLLSQVPVYYGDNPEADFEAVLTVVSGAIVISATDGRTETINLAGQTLSNLLPALPVA